jgi:hypothetical protein
VVSGANGSVRCGTAARVASLVPITIPDTPKPNMACFSGFVAFYMYAPRTIPCGATGEGNSCGAKNSGLRDKYSPSFRGFSIY